MLVSVALVRQFLRDECGTVMAETVIVLPTLLWSYLALFVYWDSFRAMNTVQKATFTVSDVISREMKTVPATYFDGLRNVMDFMLDRDQDVKMRVTSITYEEDRLQFEVLWSYSPGPTASKLPELTTATLQTLKDRIPKMADADFATIVETEVPYVPAFNVGLNTTTLKQFIITRPRFVAPNCMTGRNCTPLP